MPWTLLLSEGRFVNIMTGTSTTWHYYLGENWCSGVMHAARESTAMAACARFRTSFSLCLQRR